MAKYEVWLRPENLILIKGWARDGLTNEEIAKKMNVSRSTFSEWIKRFPEIAGAVRLSKEAADRRVENALFKMATGHTTTVKEPIKVRVVDIIEGKRVETEEVQYHEKEIYTPPNVTAQAMWLKHRQREKWGDDIDSVLEAPVINIVRNKRHEGTS